MSQSNQSFLRRSEISKSGATVLLHCAALQSLSVRARGDKYRFEAKSIVAKGSEEIRGGEKEKKGEGEFGRKRGHLPGGPSSILE